MVSTDGAVPSKPPFVHVVAPPTVRFADPTIVPPPSWSDDAVDVPLRFKVPPLTVSALLFSPGVKFTVGLPVTVNGPVCVYEPLMLVVPLWNARTPAPLSEDVPVSVCVPPVKSSSAGAATLNEPGLVPPPPRVIDPVETVVDPTLLKTIPPGMPVVVVSTVFVSEPLFVKTKAAPPQNWKSAAVWTAKVCPAVFVSEAPKPARMRPLVHVESALKVTCRPDRKWSGPLIVIVPLNVAVAVVVLASI